MRKSEYCETAGRRPSGLPRTTRHVEWIDEQPNSTNETSKNRIIHSSTRLEEEITDAAQFDRQNQHIIP
jgi:hypothetical protein